MIAGKLYARGFTGGPAMRKVIPLDEIEEPVRRFLGGLDVSPEASMVEVNGKRVYMVVRPAADPPADEPWTDAKNHRRYELIKRDIAGTITPAEIVELDQLTQELRRYVDRVAPLPFDYAHQLHEQLLKQAGENAT
jgi:hypothetical protein